MSSFSLRSFSRDSSLLSFTLYLYCKGLLHVPDLYCMNFGNGPLYLLSLAKVGFGVGLGDKGLEIVVGLDRELGCG